MEIYRDRMEKTKRVINRHIIHVIAMGIIRISYAIGTNGRGNIVGTAV